MNLMVLQGLCHNHGIQVFDLIDNTKASERYVRVTFVQNDGFRWTTVVPYYSRWSALYLEKEEDVANHLISIKQYFTHENMEAWRLNTNRRFRASNIESSISEIDKQNIIKFTDNISEKIIDPRKW